MFVTPEQVKKYTAYTVELADILIGQKMIEAYIGRGESKVTDADDIENVSLAVAYQTVYIKADPNRVFEQASVSSIVQDSSAINFDDEDAPFIAPLAKIALRNVSWKKSRSITIGRISRRERVLEWKKD